MRYFKNTELMKLHGISDKAVRNWIKASLDGKNSLELCRIDNKFYIADTVDNSAIIQSLVHKGKKYRNARSHKIIEPTPDFYNLFSDTQIIRIANALETYYEFPQEYRYRGAGAYAWESYLRKLSSSGSPNTLLNVVSLMQANFHSIEELIRNYQYVNIIDIGVGNGSAIKNVVESLSKLGKLKKYVGIDISPELLAITKKNISQWDGKPMAVETYVRNVATDQFGDILTRQLYETDSQNSVNLIFFLGGTLINFREPEMVLRSIRDSLGKNDFLISSLKLDTEASRRFFDFNPEFDQSFLPPHNKNVLDILNITPDFYDIDQGYDEIHKIRYIKVILKYSLTIKIRTKLFAKDIELNKNDTILLWRAHHFTDMETLELYAESGFDLVSAMKNSDATSMLLITKKSIALSR